MKYDEFAFFNQQLAAMLRDGIPLEGALRRLCDEMRRGKLRDELQALEADLAKGTPLAEALKARQLPELYKRMILVGVKSGDLPGALTMLADYFQRRHMLGTRLKGLMVYPLIVLFAAFLLSCFLSFILGTFIWNNLTFPRGQSFASGDFSRFVDVAGIHRPGAGCGFGRHRHFTRAPDVALAVAGFQGSEPGSGRIRHVVDAEKRRAARRCVGAGGTTGKGNRRGKGNRAMAPAAGFGSGQIFRNGYRE